MSYVACSLFFSFFFLYDINQHFFEKKDGFVAFWKKKKKNFEFIIDNIVVSFNNHCLTCSD